MGTVAMVKRVGRIKRSIKIKTNNIADLESQIANLKVELASQLDGLRHLELSLEGALEDLVEAQHTDWLAAN